MQILTTLIKKKYGVLYILTMHVYNKMSQKTITEKVEKKFHVLSSESRDLYDAALLLYDVCAHQLSIINNGARF